MPGTGYKEIADLIRGSVRGSDIAVRYGGDEFAILLPETAASVAEERAENLRRELEALELRCGGQILQVTASLGVAEYTERTPDASSLMKAVDDAMYAAKAAGRNKVVVSPSTGRVLQADS